MQRVPELKLPTPFLHQERLVHTICDVSNLIEKILTSGRDMMHTLYCEPGLKISNEACHFEKSEDIIL